MGRRRRPLAFPESRCDASLQPEGSTLSSYGPPIGLARHRVNTRLVELHHDDVLRRR
jgi:hypothetical protein